MADVENIVSRSRVHNSRYHITGGLIYTGRYFFQVLEGVPHRIESMAYRIAHDQRHTTMTRLMLHSIEQRKFEKWKMGFLSLPLIDHLIKPAFKMSDSNWSRLVVSSMLGALNDRSALNIKTTEKRI